MNRYVIRYFIVAVLILSGISAKTYAQEWEARHAMTPAQYQTLFDHFMQKGYKVKSISGYTNNGQELYEALWVKNNGATWTAKHGMSAADYQTAFTDLNKKGYRLTCLSAFGTGNQAKFAAVWEQKTGPAWQAKHNMTAAQYQQAVTDLKKQGYRPEQVCGYVVGGTEYFAAIWDKAGGVWEARHNLTAAQYQQAFTDLTKQGYTLKNVSGYSKNGADLYAAIWEKATGPMWYARHAIGSMNYQHAFDNMYYQGYYPVYLNAFASGNSTKYNAIWENTSMKGADIGYIDDAVNGYMGSQNVKGLSLAICKNGRLVFAKSYGYADQGTGEELSPNHPMRIMSISKPVTSAGIMKLYEQDNSILTKKVFGPNSILGSKYPTPAGQSKLNNITVRQLLWHSSGLRTCNGEPVFWDASKNADDAMNTLLNAGDLVKYDTSEKFNYSNANYFILARIIEKVSGQSYESFIRNNVLIPSGIGPTMYVGKADGTSQTGEVAYDPATKPNMQLWGGFGGWVARPMDLLKFLNHVDGATPPSDIMSTPTHTIMTTGSSVGMGYGFGWNISGDLQNHNGCHGSTRSFLVELANGVSYAVIINNQPSNDDCGWTMKAAIEAGLAKVSGYPGYDLF